MAKWGACMLKEGMHCEVCVCVCGRAHAWRGVCVVGGTCVVGETATAADGTHPTGIQSCYKQCIDNRISHMSVMPVYSPGLL